MKRYSKVSTTAIVAAWLFPGSGHILLGSRTRGLLLMGTILMLFIGGILIGGIDVIDRQHDKLWFAAQVLMGPVTLIVQYVRESMNDSITASIGRVNELGTLYCAIAGLLNLLAILDVVVRSDDGNDTHHGESAASAGGTS